jgi:hypothetical protein
MSTNNNTTYVSKPPKFEGKQGSAYIVWSVKFQSWAGVKGVRATLNPSFDSRLPATEDAILDETDLIQKAQEKAILQNAIAMDAMVQCISKMDDFYRVLISMQEDADWPTGEVWKTWQSIQNHYQPTDIIASRDLMTALQKIKLRKDVNPMKILSQISAIEVKFKQSLSKEKKVEVVQECAGVNYAQIIVVTDGLSQIESNRNVTALELCKAMKKVWCIKGHDNDDKEDNDVDNNSVGLETSLGTVKDKQNSGTKQKCYECGKTGHRLLNVPPRKRKVGQKWLALQQMQALRKSSPSAVTAANQVTKK